MVSAVSSGSVEPELEDWRAALGESLRAVGFSEADVSALAASGGGCLVVRSSDGVLGLGAVGAGFLAGCLEAEGAAGRVSCSCAVIERESKVALRAIRMEHGTRISFNYSPIKRPVHDYGKSIHSNDTAPTKSQGENGDSVFSSHGLAQSEIPAKRRRLGG
jgi:hypothetical protein